MNKYLVKILDGMAVLGLFIVGMAGFQLTSYTILGQSAYMNLAGILFFVNILVGVSLPIIYLFYRYGRE